MPPELSKQNDVRFRDVVYDFLRAIEKFFFGLAGISFLFGGRLLNLFLAKPFLPGLLMDFVMCGLFLIAGALVHGIADEIEPPEPDDDSHE